MGILCFPGDVCPREFPHTFSTELCSGDVVGQPLSEGTWA